MNESTLKTVALLVSIGANIFFVAFFMGKFSMPHMPPPGIERGHMAHFKGAGPNTPFGQPGPGPGKRFAMNGRDMPPPPPMFRPDDLFSPEEMKDKFSKMEGTFKKIEKLRLDFAEQLEKGDVSKEQVLKHFADVDKVMSSVKDDMQEKAAEKISKMSDKERDVFIKKLKEQHPPFEHGKP